MAFVDGVLEEIRVEARELDPAKVALTVLAAIPFVLFWSAGKVCRLVFYVCGWLWTAGLVGWRHAYNDGPSGSRT